MKKVLNKNHVTVKLFYLLLLFCLFNCIKGHSDLRDLNHKKNKKNKNYEYEENVIAKDNKSNTGLLNVSDKKRNKSLSQTNNNLNKKNDAVSKKRNLDYKKIKNNINLTKQNTKRSNGLLNNLNINQIMNSDMFKNMLKDKLRNFPIRFNENYNKMIQKIEKEANKTIRDEINKFENGYTKLGKAVSNRIMDDQVLMQNKDGKTKFITQKGFYSLMEDKNINPNLGYIKGATKSNNYMDGYNPLILSVFNRDLELFEKILLHEKTNVNIVSSLGKTALMLAIERNEVDFIKLLLKYKKLKNLNINLELKGLGSPIMHAIYWNRPEIVKLLLQEDDLYLGVNSSKNSSPLHLAASLNDRKSILLLFLNSDKFKDFNLSCNFNGYFNVTPLHILASNNHLGSILKTFLIEKEDENGNFIYRKGIDIHKKGLQSAFSPIEVAFNNKNFEFLQLILKHPEATEGEKQIISEGLNLNEILRLRSLLRDKVNPKTNTKWTRQEIENMDLDELQKSVNEINNKKL